ncbi:hypothetical protein DBV05_g9723 [Lasiodiplodia theobromae]|uniref:F-box domain-containing protein n=1 Tax=Lasiodiplodia theobromae TaxID=45133 RepID=A0A5N5D1Q2_9PEZI|nr:hypothetical protein DBV05_g9723 [Lasiodiplodia theobromae]
MEPWDCYCAFCGSTLGSATVSNKPRTAAFRRWRAREIRKAEHGVNAGDASQDEEEEEEEELIESQDEEASDGDEIYSVESQDEQHTYDSAILSRDELWWTQAVHVLGFDTDTNSLRVLDKDILYGVLRQLTPDCRNSLQFVNYGNPGPEHGRHWDSKPGEEFLCAKPTIEPKLLDRIRKVISSGELKPLGHTKTPLDLEARVRHDPFANIPYDILYNITGLLPNDSVLNLNKASWFVHTCLLNNNAFWKQRLREHTPWFHKLRSLIDDAITPTEGCDFRTLFFWLYAQSRPRLWMSGPFMALANRRRLWGVCEQISDHYHQAKQRQRPPQADDDDESNETAQLIEKHADTPRMPIVAYPPPGPDAETMSTVWIRSWAELDAPFALFEAFWAYDRTVGVRNGTSNGSLVGLAMTFDGCRRLFGRDDSAEGVSRETCLIVNPAQIGGLVLHIDPIMNKHRTWTTSVKGILDGMVGSLGLLQCARPPMDDFSLAPAPLSPEPNPISEETRNLHICQDLLWNCELFVDHEYGIWNHPSIRAWFPPSDPPRRRSHAAAVPADVIPHEVLLLATRHPADLQKLQRLSGTVTAGNDVLGINHAATSTTTTTMHHHDRVLRGAYATFDSDDNGLLSCNIHVGTNVRLGNNFDWKTELVEMDIDGPGGEVIDRVEVSDGAVDCPLSVKIGTNRGREVVWGSDCDRGWCTLRAPLGEVIVGLIFQFGRLESGQGCVMKLPELSSCGILTMPL